MQEAGCSPSLGAAGVERDAKSRNSMGCVQSFATGKGSGSMGPGPGTLSFVCDTGFGWQKQVGAVATVGMVVAQVCWGRTRKTGAQKAEKSCDF